MFDLEEIIELINYIIFTIVIILILTKQLPLERMVRRSRILIWIILIINIFSALLQFFGLISPDSNILYQLVADCLGIIGQSILLIGIVWMKLIVEPSPKPRKILVLGAHPDDMRKSIFILIGIILLISNASALSRSGDDLTHKSDIKGPGSNYWNPNNTYVDSDGKLHLEINYKDGHWNCAELDSVKNFKYGRYT